MIDDVLAVDGEPVCSRGVFARPGGSDSIAPMPAPISLIAVGAEVKALVAGGIPRRFCTDEACYRKRESRALHLHLGGKVVTLSEAVWEIE